MTTQDLRAEIDKLRDGCKIANHPDVELFIRAVSEQKTEAAKLITAGQQEWNGTFTAGDILLGILYDRATRPRPDAGEGKKEGMCGFAHCFNAATCIFELPSTESKLLFGLKLCNEHVKIVRANVRGSSPPPDAGEEVREVEQIISDVQDAAFFIDPKDTRIVYVNLDTLRSLLSKQEERP